MLEPTKSRYPTCKKQRDSRMGAIKSNPSGGAGRQGVPTGAGRWQHQSWKILLGVSPLEVTRNPPIEGGPQGWVKQLKAGSATPPISRKLG